MGSSVKINSISIDLAGATREVDAGKCEHFSIRGFVAEIRQRDRGKCWPFSVESANLEDYSYPLPSLYVPKSRWWRCSDCLKDINAEGMNGNDCQVQPSSRALREKKVDANVSNITPNKDDLNSPISADKNEKKADNANGSENVIIHEERHQKKDQTATLLKKARCRSADAAIGSKSRKVAYPEQAGKKSKEKVNISAESQRKQNREAVNGQVAEAQTTFGSTEIAGLVDDTPRAINNHNGSRVMTELEDSDNVLSESATVVRDLLDHNSPDNVTGLQQRRKTRKVRLLRELLGKSGVKSGSNVRNEGSPSKKESVRGRKRKPSGDEEWKPPETTTTPPPKNNYANRKLSTSRKTSENASESSDSEGNAESQSTESGSDKDPIKGKQRNKRFQVVDEHLPSVSRETSHKSIQENEEGSPNCSSRGKSKIPGSIHSSFSGKELVPCALHTQRTERKANLAKKKSKKSLLDNNQSTMIAFGNSVVGGNQIELRRPEGLQISSANAVSQSIRDGKRPDTVAVDTTLASEGYARKYIPQLDQRPVFSMPLQDIHHRDGRLRLIEAETNRFRDFAAPSKSNADGCFRNGVCIDLSCNNNTNGSHFPNENLRHTPTEVVDHSLAMQKDASGAYRKGKGVLIQSDHRKEKTPEHADDVPMDIVELMARNQYERCLPDKEEDTAAKNNNKQPSQTTTTKSKNGLLIDLNKTYEYGVSPEDNSSRQPKPRGQNARNEDAMTGERLPAVKPNSVEFFPISKFGQQPYVPSGLGFPLNREKPSSSIQFAGSGANGQSIHSCQWLGNVPMAATQSLSPSPFRVLCPRNTCPSAPQPYREAPHPMWPPSMVPQNQMPVSFNTHQRFMDSRGSNNDMNSWNLNFLNNGKQKRGFHSEFSFGCKHGGVGSGSLDPYGNESSIPAMHLLSLMDPRLLRSNTLVDLPENSKLPKRPFLGLQQGDCSKMPDAAKQFAFDFNSKRSSGEASRVNFPVVPPVGPSSLPFQSDKSFAKGADFAVQAPWNYLEKRAKTKDTTISPIHNSLQRSIFAGSSDPGKFQLLGASDSMMLPLRSHAADHAKKNKAIAQSCDASALPPKSNPGPMMCSMNRNPADFTIPEPGNIYMIEGEDLKFRRRGNFKKKPSLSKQDASKRNKTHVVPSAENA